MPPTPLWFLVQSADDRYVRVGGGSGMTPDIGITTHGISRIRRGNAYTQMATANSRLLEPVPVVENSEYVLIEGDYDQGAYGPTILLKLLSLQAVEWLYRILVMMRDNPDAVFDLAEAPQVHIRGVRALLLRHVAAPREVALTGPASVIVDAEFVWALDKGVGVSWRVSSSLSIRPNRAPVPHQRGSRRGAY
jgi:hypothetical protein